MNKPNATSIAIDPHAAAITAVAILSGLLEADQMQVWSSLETHALGRVELYEICSGYGVVSETVLACLIEDNPMTEFAGVYDYEVGEEYGRWLATKLSEGRHPCKGKSELHAELGRLILHYLSQDPDFTITAARSEIIRIHTGYSAVVPTEM